MFCITFPPLVLELTVQPWFLLPLNIADLLFQNIFHLPKYTGPIFLTLRSDLCIWRVHTVKGWLKGKVMTMKCLLVFLEAVKPQQGAPHNGFIVTPCYYSHQSDIDMNCCWNAFPPSNAVLT